MGVCAARSVNKLPLDAQQASKRLVKLMDSDSAQLNETSKLLLLGAGESGKSTVFKQMRIINSTGYSEGELKQFRYIIHRNILDAIKVLIESANTMGLELAEANEDLGDQVLLWNAEIINPEMAEVIARLWVDAAIQQTYTRRNEFPISDNASYFLNSVSRLGADGYTPTTEDVLHSRVRTSGVVSKQFQIKDKPYLIYDVGGQRSERRKWLPLFDHVTAIVFVASISEYDQVVREDRSKNRVQESLDLFEQIVNSKHFKDVDVILFLNKKDLFAEKIKSVDPGKWFPDYKGGCNYENAEAYFLEQFKSRVENKKKTVYSYTTCATDTNNIRVVLDSVTAIHVGEFAAQFFDDA